MGKIFKFLGSTPVSFDIVPKQVEVPKPFVGKTLNSTRVLSEDKFVSTQKQPEKTSFLKMRNGIGKLMSHFSKPKSNV